MVLSPSGNNDIEAGGIYNTLINVNNTIVGAGTVGDLDLTLLNSGSIVATASALTISSLVVNAGTMAATSGGVLRIAAGGTNSKTIVASAGGAVDITGHTIVNGAASFRHRLGRACRPRRRDHFRRHAQDLGGRRGH